MRRLALIGLTLMLPGCAYVGNPFSGFGGFIGDTHSFRTNPNRPTGNSENMRRSEGIEGRVEPLLPEPGNVWPGPTPPEPTLSDLQRQQNQEQVPPQQPPEQNQQQQQQQQQQPNRRPRGSSTPPPSVQPGLPTVEGAPAPTPAPPGQAPPTGQVFQTPNGPVVSNPGNNGIQTFTAPRGGQGIVIPNGNGTSTLIGPDGSVTTVPNPR
jgi:hypothetical protein